MILCTLESTEFVVAQFSRILLVTLAQEFISLKNFCSVGVLKQIQENNVPMDFLKIGNPQKSPPPKLK